MFDPIHDCNELEQEVDCIEHGMQSAKTLIKLLEFVQAILCPPQVASIEHRLLQDLHIVRSTMMRINHIC